MLSFRHLLEIPEALLSLLTLSYDPSTFHVSHDSNIFVYIPHPVSHSVHTNNFDSFASSRFIWDFIVVESLGMREPHLSVLEVRVQFSPVPLQCLVCLKSQLLHLVLEGYCLMPRV